MSTLLNLKGEVIADAYALLADDAPLPATGAVLVNLARWQAEAATLAAHAHPVAVKLPNTVDVLTLEAEVLSRPLLVLDFPAFGDGRAYSQARRLRDRRGYKGAIRATGAAVMADQLQMMARSGLDEFALRADQDVALCQRTLTAVRPLPYQPARDLRRAVFAARQP